MDNNGAGVLGAVVLQAGVDLLEEVEDCAGVGGTAVIGPTHELPMVQSSGLDWIAFVIKTRHFEPPRHVLGRLHLRHVLHAQLLLQTVPTLLVIVRPIPHTFTLKQLYARKICKNTLFLTIAAKRQYYFNPCATISACATIISNFMFNRCGNYCFCKQK